MEPLQRALYRSLIRCASTFDHNPVLKAFIFAAPPKSDTHYRKAVDRFLDNSSLFRPLPHTNQSLVQAVQSEYRTTTSSRPDFVPSLQTPQSPQTDANHRPETGANESSHQDDAAFHALRNLNHVLSVAVANIDYDPSECSKCQQISRALAQRQYDEEAEEAKWIEQAQGKVTRQYTPQPGYILVTHPLQDGWFEQTAVLITQTSLINGSKGLVLNRPINTHEGVSHSQAASDSSDEENAIEFHIDNDLSTGQIEGNDSSKSVSALAVPLRRTGVATLPAFSAEDTHSIYTHPYLAGSNPFPPGGSAAAYEADEASSAGEEFEESSDEAEESLEAIRFAADIDSAIRNVQRLQTQVDGLIRRILPHTGMQLEGEQMLAQINSGQDSGRRPDKSQKIFLGGPIDNSMLTYVHSNAKLGGVSIGNLPLYIGRSGRRRKKISLNKLSALVQKHKDEVAGFFGDCEWEGMQLENELADGRWLMFEVDSEAFIRPNDNGEALPWCHRLPTWSAILKAAGQPYEEFTSIAPASHFCQEMHEVE